MDSSIESPNAVDVSVEAVNYNWARIRVDEIIVDLERTMRTKLLHQMTLTAIKYT